MRNFTKIIGFSLTLFFGIQAVEAQQSVGVGTNTPDVSARLDINASDKGLLIPKVFLLSLSDAVTIATPANGLMLYNTNKTLPGGTGFYYNSGTSGAPVWARFQTGASAGNGWGLTGNAATDSTVNFLGTTDVKPLVFKLNNLYAGQLGANGGIALGRGANETSRITPGSLIAIGDSALFNNTDSFNIAIGKDALYRNGIGTNNTAIGNASLVNNINGSGNVSIGDFTLVTNDSGYTNVAIGYGASNGTTQEENTAIGALALSSDQFGFGNTAIGFQSQSSNGNGVYNVSVGHNSMFNNFTGIFNTGIGKSALYGNTTGSRNNGLGYRALYTDSTGNKNIGIGNYAGNLIKSGSNNICIGDSANPSTGTTFNSIAIGIDLQSAVYRPSSNQARIGNASTSSIGGQVGWSTLSDARYKKNVQENVKGLEFILKLRPVSYMYDFEKINNVTPVKNESTPNLSFEANKTVSFGKSLNKAGLKGFEKMKNDRTGMLINDTDKREFSKSSYAYLPNQNEGVRFTGFLAQEVEVTANQIGFQFSGVDKPTTENGTYSLRYSEFVVPLVKAVQEQQAIIDAQNKKIDDLIKRLEKLEQK